MKNANIFEQTLAAEQAAAKAAEEKAAKETAINEIIDREEAKERGESRNLFETIKLIKEGHLFVVKLKVLANEPADNVPNEIVELPIGGAVSEADAAACVETLRAYAPRKRLLTAADLRSAMMNAANNMLKADQAVVAGVTPDRSIVVDGVEYLITKGTEVRRASDGKLIKVIKSLANITDPEDIEELVKPAIREAAKAVK